MLEAIKTNPVMVLAGIIAIVNILVGDQTQTAALIESLGILGGGLVVRAKVTPTNKLKGAGNAAGG